MEKVAFSNRVSIMDQRNFTQIVRETVVRLCRSFDIFGGVVDIDGIICISGKEDGQELVVKLHENVSSPPPLKRNYSQQTYTSTPPNNFYRNLNFARKSAQDLLQDGKLLPESPIRPTVLDNGYGYNNNNTRFYTDGFYNEGKRRRLKEENDIWVSDVSFEHQPTAMSPSSEFVAKSDQQMSKQKSLSPFSLISRPKVTSAERRRSSLQPLLICRQCNVDFKTCEDLSSHNETVHSLFTCQFCQKTFTSRSNLERHLRLHTGFKPYVCNICKKAFSRKDHLSNHVAKHAYRCGHCTKSYNEKSALAHHLEEEHKSGIALCCDLCNKGFCNRDAYEEHLSSHSTQRSPSEAQAVECDSCQTELPNTLMLLKHRLLHQENYRCFTCLSCAKVFSDPLLYEEHLLCAHGNETNVYECTLCRQILPTHESLKKHEESHVANYSDYEFGMRLESIPQAPTESHPCLSCSATFESYSKLMQHMDDLKHHDKGEKMQRQLSASSPQHSELRVSDVEVVEPEAPDDSSSNIEPPSTKTPDNASESCKVPELQPTIFHDAYRKAESKQNKRKGTSPEKYVTDDTDSSLIDVYDSDNTWNTPVSQLNGSMSSDNNGASSSKYERKREKNIQSRMSVNIPEGPYTCSVCQMTMSNFHILEQHTFVEHNRCPCMFCPKTFAQKANRDRHVCLHTGDKPYECSECGEKFSRGDKLKLHRLRTHTSPGPISAVDTFSSKKNLSEIYNDWTESPIGHLSGSSLGWSTPVIETETGSAVHGGGEWHKITDEKF